MNSSPPRPNILFFLADQHRRDWLGFKGVVPVRTPNIDALARRGVSFDRAWCASPLCGPSRACLASGRDYAHCGVPDHSCDYPLGQATYYQVLRDAGYHVAGCGKFDLHKASPTWGLDGRHLLREWGFSDGIDNAGKWDAVHSGTAEPRDPYMAFLHARGLAAIHAADFHKRGKYEGTFPTPLPDDAYCDNWIAQNGLGLMEEFPAGRPWHLVVNFTGPHDPMDVTASMHRLYRDPPVGFPGPHQETKRNYAAMIENIDRWLGVYLARLERRGELQNTIVVYSSDHGEMLGDRGLWEKHCLYEPSAGIPLVIAGPGMRQGLATDALVSLIDLAATFADYAGASLPGDTQALSLRPLLEGAATTHRPRITAALGQCAMAFDGRHKLITGYYPGMPFPEMVGHSPLSSPTQTLLYDLQQDPAEQTNLAPAQPALVKQLLSDTNP